MIEVNATKLRRNLKHYNVLIERQPIEVTRLGKPSTVMMSAQEYRRLTTLDDASSGSIQAETEV